MASAYAIADQLAVQHPDQLATADFATCDGHVVVTVTTGDRRRRIQAVTAVAVAHRGAPYATDAATDVPMWHARFRVDGVPVLVRTPLE